MIEITQVNASLDEAGDENACLIVGKRVAVSYTHLTLPTN